MRFFKYLIFITLFSISIDSYAALLWYTNAQGTGTGYSTPAQACIALNPAYPAPLNKNGNTYTCWTGYHSAPGGKVYNLEEPKPTITCPSSGMPQATYFANNSPIPTQTCKQNSDGTYCIANYKGSSSPNNPLVIGTNSGQQIILNSVSSIPSPSCTPIFSKSTCDSKDPYGGCYKPPNDDCNRMSDGSIYCPPDAPQPQVTQGCNGATYCNRPPQGCGTGYVSGSFNGQQICVKTNPSTDTGEGSEDDETGTGSNTTDGTGTSTTTGTETSTTTNSDGSSTTTNTTTNNTTVNNFKIDFSPVVSAVKQVSADIKNLKNELLTSISELSKKLDLTNTKIDTTNTKIDQTNSKLDVSNTNLTSIKDSSLRQEELLKSIRDKSGSGSASGAQTDTDLSGVTSRLDAIKEGIDEQNSSDKEFLDMIKDKNYGTENGDFTGDSKIEILEQTASPEMKGNILNASAACPAPYVINYDLLGSRSMSFSWDIFCSAASFFRPVFIFLGMFIGFKIATGSYKDS